VLAEAGYVVMSFDYKGWDDSEGPKSRLAPYSRVADVQAALTFLGAQPEVDAARLGIYGTSYGGATVVFVAAVDPRVKCVVSVVGVGNGARWMRSIRRPDEYHDLLTRAAADRDKRVRGTKAATPWRPESSDRCSGSGYWSNATKRFQTMSSEIAIFIERHSCLIDCLPSQSKLNCRKASGIESSSVLVGRGERRVQLLGIASGESRDQDGRNAR
jgi:alpha/beta superfamily hydrolase